MARDEARHGKALKGLLERYFKKDKTLKNQAIFERKHRKVLPLFLRFAGSGV